MLSADKKVVIFDLDGTILDTIADIAEAVNRATASFGYPSHTVDEIASFLGNGSLMLMRRALGGDADDELCRAVRTRFRAEYETCMYDQTVPYAGIKDLFRELRALGVAIVVITNKDDRNAVPMIDHYFGDLVDICRGVRSTAERKPDPGITLSILGNMGFSPEEAVFVGDGMADLNVSKNAGIEFIPVGYGYTSAERLYAECGKMPVKDTESLREAVLSYIRKESN